MLIYKYKDIIKFFFHCYNNRIESYTTKCETFFPNYLIRDGKTIFFFLLCLKASELKI